MNNEYMKAALKLALEAADEGEVPVGAVIVKDGKIIATGRNRRETGNNALYHAEIEAIDNACKAVGGWRLNECDLYVTMEPCPMCAGAIINARIKRVYYGAYDQKAGSFGTIADFNRIPYNHKPEIYAGIMEEECVKIVKDFFKSLRDKPKS
ncbi:MAG: nucleoside deaminase [Eubacteriales bacterium]|nr:nucleoside deaminase [Eubacteriales bacterium]